MRYADEAGADVWVREHGFDGARCGCDCGDGTGVEVRWDRGPGEAAEDVRVEVEFCEVGVQDYAFGGKFANGFVEF
jgi:hypothetical protein